MNYLYALNAFIENSIDEALGLKDDNFDAVLLEANSSQVDFEKQIIRLLMIKYFSNNDIPIPDESIESTDFINSLKFKDYMVTEENSTLDVFFDAMSKDYEIYIVFLTSIFKDEQEGDNQED